MPYNVGIDVIIPTLLPAKKRGPKRRLDTDPTYRGALIELWPTKTAKEIAALLGTTDRTVERDVAELRRRQKSGTPGPTAMGSRSDLSTGVIQQNQKNDTTTTPSPDAGGTGEPDGGK